MRVTRPQRFAELRLSGLDDSIATGEVLEAVAEFTAYRPEDLTLASCLSGSVWVRCPVAASNTLIEAGFIRIGWSRVTVRALPSRRMRCFRCLECGHTAANCRGEDRSGRCHRPQ